MERLTLPDGDFLDVAWGPPAEGPLLLVIHGLEGSVQSHYARGLLASAADRGWQGLVLHFRGCSGEPNRGRRRYHAGDITDLAWFHARLRERWPARPLYTAGFSLGGSALLHFLAAAAHAPVHPLAAAAVSVPFHLEDCARRLERGFSRLYQRALLRRLVRSHEDKRRRYPRLRLPGIPPGTRTFRAFDDAVTAPLHGFAGVEDYYRRCSPAPALGRIRVPTLVVHARDDPFMFPSTAPGPGDVAGGAVRVEIARGGGHVGFVHGPPWRPCYWLEQRLMGHFLERERARREGPRNRPVSESE